MSWTDHRLPRLSRLTPEMCTTEREQDLLSELDVNTSSDVATEREDVLVCDPGKASTDNEHVVDGVGADGEDVPLLL